jgi:predicted naringenin-chalcone synthase
MYNGTGIERRHVCQPRAVVDDILNGTRDSGSLFLPEGTEDDRGPTTAERVQVYAEEAGPLAVRAARTAMVRAGMDAQRVTHLVTVSCTGFMAPGVDADLIAGLELSPGVQRTHIGYMGCHGALNGLRVARAFAEADPNAVVLTCAVELCSLHYHYGWDAGRIVANAIFADGAAAIVGRASDDHGAWRLIASGSCVFPDSRDAMTWIVGDHGFVMSLSKKVPGLIGANLKPWLDEWLSGSGLTIADVASWAIHPGGPRILTAVEESINLPREKTADAWHVLTRFGNMSSPTVLFILERLRQKQAPRPCVALGFGPGLAVEAALFE